MNSKISDKVINRLTLYHCILQEFLGRGEEVISSGQIAKLLHIDDSQVRKDISVLNNTGKSRVGYIVKELKSSIEKTLGFKKQKNACIIGAGNLGSALAKYDSFANYGLNIVALVDTDKNKISGMVNGKRIFALTDFASVVKENGIDIAILTVPKEFTQSTADIVVASGVKYIWNFAPVVLNVPDDVQVWNENLVGNFLQFTYNI